MTLTLTKTSTVLDTITHTISHTLVQPTTIVATSLMEDDKIVATSTVQEVPPYSHYPSFPGQETMIYGDNSEPHPTFLEDEANLDEFIINYDDEIQVKKSPNPNQHQNVSKLGDNDSIFVVMTDQKQPSIINTNPSMIDKTHRINAMSEDDKLNEINDDASDSNNDDAVNRDEDDMTRDVNHVLLGGILIASPPQSDKPKMFTASECRPDCKAARNELCQKIEGQMKCVCRPGFARMFPDRPCKPTYTYTINLPLVRHGKEKLKFEEALTKSTSPKYTHLSSVVHDGLDRMVMQSDLRDIYHGVHLIEFKNGSTHRHPEDQQADGNGITSVFYLQLSDNYDDMRLLDIFHKYLRNNNYSLGGTDLYSSHALVNDMTATDFDECVNANTKFNDCSEDAHCFNLRGTYTCSCREGFADLSSNPIYPGRICSAELIGCEKCNYHGTCYSRGDDQMLCECFQWYAGKNCHVNLKVMLIALITFGLILFLLLLICLILTCCKRKRPNNRTLIGMGLVSNKLVANQRTMDRRAMIPETSSETSDDTHTLPYDRNKQNQLNKNRQNSSNLSLNKKFTIATQNSPPGAGHSTLGMEQKDISLTVMIPRAKYHPAAPPPPPIVVATTRYNVDPAPSVCSTTEAKLLSYLDASPSATTLI
ncbi:Transmembrane matrix receptor MUP-4 [Pseudolycoriella hygida]|uniref:Transmembrane matrix receptor MUP-4 n=1 Tax=Pseudolycoriella hygida TaxID=35572 RepID=A0A9Q0N6N6_9DIPT|nr:Transmembrane matrix receptor MUP-4 [Pseudolycoriella hygida]